MKKVPALKNGKSGFYTKRVGVNVDGSAKPLIIACIVPIRGSSGNDIEKAVRVVGRMHWNAIARRVEADGHSIAQPVSKTLDGALRAATLPAALRTTGRDSVLFDGIQRLGTVTVTARANFAWWSYHSLMGFLSQYGEGWDSERAVRGFST